jgi:putative spermidine/putrescine transport system permease protein
MVAVVPELGATTPTRRRPRIGRAIVLILAGLYFLVPVAAAFWFSVNNGKTGFTLHAYTGIVNAPGFLTAFGTSLKLAIITVVLTLALMVPTMLLVHLRHPRLRVLMEVLCLLPLVIPPVVLVVGVRTVLGWGPDQLAGTPLQSLFNGLQNSSPPWILALEYVILALPFTYRALDAGLRSSGVATLVEAARNLGSSWPTVVFRVVLPTLRTSVLNAAFLAFALVLGEFTMANILLYQTFTVWILQFNDTDGQLSVGLSLMSLFITWLLLLLIAALGGGRTRKDIAS